MITISLIAAALAAAQYQYSPPAASPSRDAPRNDAAQGFDAEAVAQVYRKCFEAAENETRAAAANVKQQKFDACRSKHDVIIEHVTAKLDGSEARQLKRALHSALTSVENSYAKRMGVVLPASAK